MSFVLLSDYFNITDVIFYLWNIAPEFLQSYKNLNVNVYILKRPVMIF